MADLSGLRVLVTGDTGFKGAWLAALLVDAGAEVHGFALPPPTTPSLFEAAGLGDRIRHRDGDVRDGEAVLRAVEAARPDVVFHLAAQALVRLSYAEPVETFDTNVMGTVRLLEALRRLSRPAAVVVVTSDKCYEEHGTPRSHVEDDPFGGHDPYAASKGAAEIAVASYRRSFFPPESRIRVATARAGNVVGGGDFAPDRIVPDIVRALVSGKTVKLRNPAAVRPWQHVLDALSGYVTLAERLLDPGGEAFAEGWNFGPGGDERVDVRALTERMIARWGEGAWEPAGEASPPREAPFLALDVGKAGRRLGWSPRWSVGEAIDATVAWYDAMRRGEDLWETTVAQIRAHRGAAA